MKEELVEIPVSVELKKKLNDLVEQEIAKLEKQLETLKEQQRKMLEENNYNWVLKYLKEEYDATYV